MYVAEVSQISPEDLEKLFYNGFDNPESIELCTLEDLQQLQISDPELVLEKLHMTVKFYKENPQTVEQPDIFTFED